MLKINIVNGIIMINSDLNKSTYGIYYESTYGNIKHVYIDAASLVEAVNKVEKYYDFVRVIKPPTKVRLYE